MFRITGAQFQQINFHANGIFYGVRKICANSCVQLNKTRAEELAAKKQKEQDKMKWTKLYQFDDMKYHSILTRLKIYTYTATVVLSPLAYIFEFSQIFPDFSAIPSLAVGLTSSVILTAYSKALANTIGIIYICRQNKLLQIAYIDFWGKQHFIDTTVEDVHKWDKSMIKLNSYKTVKAIDGKEEKFLKISWKRTSITDAKLFRRMFGK